MEKIKLGNKSVYPFTIPSGIVTTEVSCLVRMAEEIPELGILTTKSIGPQEREGNREPILTQYIPGGFLNAVGLTNPGAEKLAEKLSLVNFPEEKFLLASIFGKDASEFVFVVKTLEKLVDGFELNLSCPHAKGYGMQLGQDKKIVSEITKEVVKVTRKPVFAKLTPNAKNIGEIASEAISSGAEGIVAINTVGPGFHSVEGNSVLTNEVGGLSGVGITPIGLKCVREVRKAVGESVPIIGMGGIKDFKDVENYKKAGATVFGIGSALAGLTEKEIKEYFSSFKEGRKDPGRVLKKVDMKYEKVEIKEKMDIACDFKVIKTDLNMDSAPGQFVFAWIPGVGEKPFSVMEEEPLTLGILERGELTGKMNSLQKGDSFYIRGPYGKGVSVPDNSNVVLVGGGCGAAGLLLLAKKFSESSEVLTLLGAKDKDHLVYVDEFKKYGSVRIITEDGSSGEKGLVTDFLNNIKKGSYFFNCGSEKMIEALLPLELEISKKEKIYSSFDYLTKCGIGICGSCADREGRRTCVEGPFIN